MCCASCNLINIKHSNLQFQSLAVATVVLLSELSEPNNTKLISSAFCTVRVLFEALIYPAPSKTRKATANCTRTAFGFHKLTDLNGALSAIKQQCFVVAHALICQRMPRHVVMPFGADRHETNCHFAKRAKAKTQTNRSFCCYYYYLLYVCDSRERFPLRIMLECFVY